MGEMSSSDMRSVSWFFLVGFIGLASLISVASADGSQTFCQIKLCKNNGHCQIVGLPLLFSVCICINGWIGDDCNTRNYCYPNPCLNSGSCSNCANDYSCKCPDGWIGKNCTTPHAGRQASDGKPSSSSQDRQFSNAQGAGATGGNQQQQQQQTPDIQAPSLVDGSPKLLTSDNCSPNPCANGNCTNGQNGYNCSCSTGWTGVNCTIRNYCDPNPCSNGNCTNEQNGYNCSCATGWTGTNCTTQDYCASNPCANGGVCTDVVGGYNCTCKTGWTGATCSKCICDQLRPCQNGGSCYHSPNAPNGYSCNCNDGYSGVNCEQGTMGYGLF